MYLVSDYFTGDGITDGTLYHIRYGLHGSGFLEYKGLIFSLAVLVFAVLVFLWFVVSKKYFDRGKGIDHSYLTFFLMGVSVLSSPAIPNLYHLFVIPSEGDGMSTVDYYKQYEFLDFYRKPVLKKVGEKKNFVFIYAESFEQTYSDEDIFPLLTEKLKNLSEKSIVFTNLQQIDGTGHYTIAGFVSSQCGIPLVGPVYGNAMSGMDSYLPSAYCLGDILSEEGYELVYYGGADSFFAGKDLFLKTHGFSDVYGKRELLPHLQDSSYVTSWGLYDDSLFEIAYDNFLELSARDTPFGLFLLTLDTHQPNGRPSKSCEGIRYKDGSDAILNGIACSDHLIANFVEKILSAPNGNNTVIVIASDHLAPHNSDDKSVDPAVRSNRFMIIPAGGTPSIEVKEIGSTLDMGATLLPFIGYQGDSSIGLGRNLLDPWQSEFEREIIQSHISQWKDSLSAFWNFPEMTNGIEINTQRKVIVMGEREFKIPVLIEISQGLHTKLNFQFDIEFDSGKGKKDLITQVKKIAGWTSFVLIHTCDEVRKIDDSLKADAEFCLVAGVGGNYSVSPIFDGIRILTKEDVMSLTHLR